MGLRSILVLLIGMVGLALVRNVIREISRLLLRSRKSSSGGPAGQPDASGSKKVGGRLVQDPHTGTYIDPAHAVRAQIRGTVHYFESEASRDAFLKANA